MSASDAATITASTKRYPAVSGGKVGPPVTNLSSVLIVSLLPLTPELAQMVKLEAPREAKLTFAFADSGNVLPDIVEGDILVVSGVEYAVRSVAEFQRPGSGSFLQLVVEQHKVS